MNRVSRYIFKQLVVSTALIGFVITGVIWLFVAVKAVESIVNRGLSVELFLSLTALQLPNFLTQIIPISLFIAVLFVYTRLTSDREIVVLRAAGMSPISLAKPMIIWALILTFIVYGLTLVATPKSYQKFRDLQWDIRYSLAHIVLKEGVFNSFSTDITVYVRERTSDNELKGMLVHDNRDKKRPVTYHAESGSLIEAENGAKVVLLKGNSIVIDKENPQINRVVYFDRHNLDLSGIIKKPDERYREARERMVGELLMLKKKDVGNPKDFGKFVVEGHQRLSSPLTVLGFSLMALACLMLGDYSRKGNLNRILTAVSLFIILIVLNLAITNLSAKNLTLIPALYANSIIPLLVSFILLLISPRSRNKSERGPVPNTASP